MKRRLFWKILLAFWVTFFAITQGVWLLFELNRNQNHPPDEPMARVIAPLVLEAAGGALARGGPGDARRLADRLPANLRDRLDVEPASAPILHPALPGERLDVANAVAPGGRAYRLSFRYRVRGPPLRLLPGTPPELLILGLAGGLVFSALLAWYLTEPISRLRKGFDRLAAGDLTVRVGPKIGSRRDEIADLGRDFDAMAQRLQELVAARDRLLHDVSHELRSPLARLQLAVGLARQAPERTETTLARVERDVQRLEMLVEQLLALARAERGEQSGEDYFDLGELVASVADDARFEAAASEVDIRVRESLPPPDQRPLLTGNAELVHRALENVLRNALRFSAAGQTIEVEVGFDGPAREYRVEIADEGPGIPPAEIDAMFQPFVRGEDGSSGLGLGLSIASRAVAAHGGAVKARNRNEGGFIVSLNFPVADRA